MANPTEAIKKDPHQLRVLAVRAHCDPRTVQSYLDGRRVHSTTRARIEAVLNTPDPAALVRRLYQIPAAALVTRQLASVQRTNSNARGDKPQAPRTTKMNRTTMAQVADQINHEDEGVKVIVNRTEAPPTRATSKQMAAGLNMGRDPFEAFLDAQRVAFVVIARQRVYLVADVEEAIRRAGKIAPPVGKSKKTAPRPKMTPDEIAEAAGLSLVKGGTK